LTQLRLHSCGGRGCGRIARRVRGVSGRETIEIPHPAGEEMQWDWFERRGARPSYQRAAELFDERTAEVEGGPFT